MAILAFTGLNDVVRADASVAPTIVVNGLHTVTIGSGATATISANISGGIPVSAVNGTYAGYMIFFFYGQTDAHGALGFDKQIVPAPSGCTTPDAVCTTPDEVTFSHTYNHAGSFDTSLTVYDAAGDYAIATAVVNVIPSSLTVSAHAENLTAAEDSPIHFEANVTTNPLSDMSDGFAFEWSFGDNTTGWGNPIDHAYAESGNYVATVRAFDNTTGAANQTSVGGIEVTNPAPVAGIEVVTPTVTPNTFLENTSVVFSAAGTSDVPTDAGNLRYYWSFGDGQLGAGFFVSHVYTETGSFPVALTVTDEEGLSSTVSTTVNVTNVGPVAHAATSTIAVGNVAFLHANATSDVPVDLPSMNYTWSSAVPLVTDMGSSSGIVGRDGYFAPGSYTANLLATDAENLTGATSVNVPVVDAPPNVGVYSMYTLANISVVLAGTPGNTILVSVVSSGHVVTTATITRTTMAPKGNVLTLTNVPLSLADQDTITLQELLPPVSPTSSNPVTVSVSFWGDNPCPPHVPKASCSVLYYTNTFYPGVQPGFVWRISGNQASVGRLVFLKAQVFSPGRTTLTTTWQFGDGSSSVSTTLPPASAQPTLGYLTAQHRWAAGSSYAFTVSTRDSAPSPLSNQSTLVVSEGAQATVNDIAPVVALVTPATEPASAAERLNATVSSELYSASSFGLVWHFGDSLGAAQSGVGANATETHFYGYSATKYAVAVYASDRPGGPATVSWQFLTITNSPPVPSFTAPVGPVAELAAVTFNASQSVDFNGGLSGTGLSYAWNFGDNTPTVGGSRGAEMVTSHNFTREGTFPVTLTVTDAEGLSASLTRNVTVGDVPTFATLLNRTVVVDQYATFSLASLTGAATDVALLRATWHWGDGATSTGLVAGHTYLAPGSYTLSVTLASEDSDPLMTLYAVVTVVDQPLSVSLPYEGYAIYGENHSVTFYATVFGSPADSALPPNSFTYTWSFGDNTSATTTGGLTGSVSHVYSMSGNPVLSVEVSGPNGSYGSASATLTTIPNWDGDGIPDAYATAVLHLPAGNDPSHGTGLTDFMSEFVVKAQPTTGKSTGDGLTAFEDVFGTVTGYVSNPLDPNVAGDGILNGAHQFSDSFTAPSVVQFTGSGAAQIPGVYHPSFLNPASLRSVTLYAEVVSPTLSALTLNLTDLATGHSGTYALLGSMSEPVQNWTLLDSTPVGGPHSNYSLTVPDFQTNSTWQLTVSGGNGSIQSASIVITYYTDPNLADPFGAGLLLGADLSIPVFNASEATNANYTVFDGKTFTYSTVDYYPYTEQYYKLSVVQGLPYYPWDNASYNANTNSTGALVTDPHAFATYYGDKEFGIGPWQVHAAGDPGLTNGMKAYGRAVYDLTANHYLLATGNASFGASIAPPPYPSDTLAYSGPLNPTALSTGTSGVADSKAINPVKGPEVFGVTVSSGWSECVLQGLTLAIPAVGQGVISNLDVTNATGAPATVFTGSTNEDDHAYNASIGCYYWHFTFNAHYQLPVNTSKPTNTIRLGIDFANAASDAYGGSLNFVVSTDPSAGTQSVSGEIGANCAQFCISGSVTAFPLARTPVTIVNATGEVHNLPGYGPHWHGDRHFYSIYLNLNDSGSGTPFQQGTNVILVSGTAFTNSTLNASLGHGNVSSLPFLADATFSRRGNASDTYILGTLNATLNSSDAMQLLGALVPHNATGHVMGSYLALTQTQFELLGLSDQVMHASPYEPYPTSFYSATSAAAPTTFFGEILNVLTTIWEAIVSVAMAIANFFVNLVAEIGQAIIGAWNSFVAAVQSAVNAIVQAFDFLIQWIDTQFAILKADINNATNQLAGAIVGKLVLPAVSLMYDVGVLSESTYNSTYQYLVTKYNLTDPAAISSDDAHDQIAAIINIVTGVISAVAVIVGVVLYIVGIATVGVGEAAEEVVQTAGLVTTFTIQGAILGGIVATLAALSGIASAVFTIASSVNDNILNTWFNSTFGSLLGASVSDALSIVTGIGLAIGDALLANAVEGLSGYYIAGAVLGVIGVIVAGVAAGLAAANTSRIAQIALFAIAIVVMIIGMIVPLLPISVAIEEGSQTVLMGVGIAVFAGAAVIGTVGGLALAITDFQHYGN